MIDRDIKREAICSVKNYRGELGNEKKQSIEVYLDNLEVMNYNIKL